MDKTPGWLPRVPTKFNCSRSNTESQYFYTMIRNYLTDFLPNTRNLSPCTIQAARDERNCSNATLNQRLSCLRSFFRFAAYEDASYISIYQTLTAIPRRKTAKNKTIDFMSENALKAVLSVPDPHTRTGLRDAFYMALMYDSAARNSEIVAMRLQDIVDGKAPYVFVNGKGRKKRSIPLERWIYTNYI